MTLASDDLQRTDDWHRQRWGKITGSRIKDVMSLTAKGLPSANRTAYLWELVKQRLTEYDPNESNYVNAAMQHGIDQEANAIAFYQAFYDVEVTPAPFIQHSILQFSGASPDGLIESITPGVVEVKCMNTTNHLKALHDNTPPEQYLDQCHWEINVTGSAYCDLVLYDPRVPEELQMKVFRINRDQDYIQKLEDAVTNFNQEVEATIATIKENTK